VSWRQLSATYRYLLKLKFKKGAEQKEAAKEILNFMVQNTF